MKIKLPDDALPSQQTGSVSTVWTRLFGRPDRFAKLSQSELMYLVQSHFFEASPLPLARFDQSMRMIFCNQAWARLVDATVAKLVGTTCLLNGLNANRQQYLQRSMQAGQPISLSMTLNHDNGRTQEIDVWFTPEAGPDSQVITFTALGRDMTEQKRQADLFNQTRQRLDFAMRGAKVSTWEWLVQQNRIRIQGTHSVITGRPGVDQEVIPVPVFINAVHPDDRLHLRKQLISAMRGETAELSAEFRILDPGSDRHHPQWRWAHVRGAIVERDLQKGTAKRMAGIFHEINDRKEAELALKSSEARFKSLLELSADYYWELDEQFRFVTFDGNHVDRLKDSLCEIELQQTVSEFMIGKCRWDLPGHEIISPPMDWVSHQALLETHVPFAMTVRHQSSNGGDFYYDIRGTPWWDEQGHFNGYRGVSHDVTERMRNEQRVRHLAYHDALTELPNRMLMQDRVERILSESRRTHQQFALLFMDLDNFKAINDTQGHDCGDEVLRVSSQRLLSRLREADTLARFAGDEFVILLPLLRIADDAALVAEKLLDALREPILFDGKQIFVSGSIGIAVYPNDGETVEKLLDNADAAMYAAKQAGRNNYHFFTSKLNLQRQKRLAIESEMRAAFERGEFSVYYQPKFDLATRALIGTEALLRWQRNDGSFVDPSDFIPIAEENGMIGTIGRWVLRQAVMQTRQWHAQGLKLSIAVNVSAVQLRQKRFIDFLRETLEESGISVTSLILELTETALLAQNENGEAIIQRVHDMGVTLSLDDFGTGFSSLSYLQRYPFKEVKIDRSFTRDICDDVRDAALVRAIIGLAKNLGLNLVAEGIETPRQLTMLALSGCPFGQGYLFSRPLSVNQFNQNYLPAHSPG